MGCSHSSKADLTHDVCLHHFEVNNGRVIGKGAFGKVRAVEHKRSKTIYALKYINKQQCIKQNAVMNILHERRLLEEVQHPFLVNLRYAFQDEENCFFVLDLMMGGDLRHHLNMKGCFPEWVVRFWTAEIASGLAFLHERRIIHRDLKPDNILLDAAGHAHISDFNTATYYSPRRGHTSMTGTFAYMAPEVVHPARLGYQWQVDWWSLGVVAYELLWGVQPFTGRSAEKMTQSILSDPIQIPFTGRPNIRRISNEGCHLVKSLLDRNQRTRLGCGSVQTSLEEIWRHPWFASLDFRALQAKELPSPFVPDPSMYNFDLSHEIDEYMNVEKRLSSKKRRTPIDPEKLSPEQRKLLLEFTTFDFERPLRHAYQQENSNVAHIPSAVSFIASAPPTQTAFVGLQREPSPSSSATSSGSESSRSSHDLRYPHSLDYGVSKHAIGCR